MSIKEEKNISNRKIIKLMGPFVKPYYGVIWFILLLLPIGSLAFSVQPLIIQRAIDGPLSARDLSGLYIWVLSLIAVITINVLVQITQTYLIMKLGQNMVTDIRLALFSHLEKLPMSFFDRNPVGKSVTRITSDMEQLAESFAGGLVLTFADLFNVVAVSSFMFYLNWQLCMTIVLFLFPMYWMAKYFQSEYRDSNLKARIELAKLNSFLQQNIVGISVVQLLNSTEKNTRIFNENNKRFFEANDRSIRADSMFSAGIEFMSIFAIATLIILSMLMISGRLSSVNISMGVVIAFLQYTQALFDPIRNLSDRFTVIQSGFTAAERVNQLLDEPISVADPTDNRQSPIYLYTSSQGRDRSLPVPTGMDTMTDIEIAFNNVGFKYDVSDDWALKNLSFTIKAHERIALVGKTGSGKSTIIKLLTRLYDPQQGNITVNGIDIKNFKQKDLRELISVIHQDSYIFAGNLESNIYLNRDREKINMDLAKPFLKAVSLSLSTELSERAANISAGEEQVINFARAIVSKPRILVLDEATAKIDLRTESVIKESLEQYYKLYGCTLISIAHKLETIQHCDRILVIDQGSIVEEGTHSQLLSSKGLYAGLYAQMR